MKDGKTFGENVVAVVKEYLDTRLEEMVQMMEARFKALPIVDIETPVANLKHQMDDIARRLDELPAPITKDAVVEEVREEIVEIKKAVGGISDMIDGFSKIEPPELPDIPKMITDATTPVLELVRQQGETLAKQIEEMPWATVDQINELKGDIEGHKENIARLHDRCQGLRTDIDQVPDDLSKMVDQIETLEKAVAELPRPDVMKADVDSVFEQFYQFTEETERKFSQAITRSQVEEMVNGAIEELPEPTPGEPGKSVELADVVQAITPTVKELVTEAVAAVPAPKDGHSVTIDDVAPMIRDAVSKAVSELPKPRDGIDGANVANVMTDEKGVTHLVLSNGNTLPVGNLRGLPGTNGLGIKDFGVEYNGERIFTFKWANDDQEYTEMITVPIPIYRGLYEDGKEYEAGDVVTRQGSQWYCKEDTNEAPANGEFKSDKWVLSVKKGRDRQVVELPSKTEPKTVKISEKK